MMASHGIIGILIDNTTDVEQNTSNSYVTSPTANLHENMIILDTASVSVAPKAKRRLPASILGGLGDDKQQERENSINSKTISKSKIVKKRICKKGCDSLIDMRKGKEGIDKNGEEETENVNVKVKEKLSIKNFETMFSYKYNIVELKKICLQL
jgi:hypothetical protein